MNELSTPLESLEVGRRLGPLELRVSSEGNRRYWSAADVEHPWLRDGVLYPPMAANLTILLAQTVVEHPMLHTAQELRCRSLARVGELLTVHGHVAGRETRRGRTYVAISATIANSDGVVWESIATFTPAGDGTR